MKLLKLTQDKQTLLDNEDWEWVKKWKWSVEYDGWNYYAVSRGRRLHRELLKLQKGDGKQVDHINGNGLDNRKINLRVCTRSENLHNRKIEILTTRKRTSKFKGVCWDKHNKRWRAEIQIDKKAKLLGTFLSEIEAAVAYDKIAFEYFGKFARLNFPTKKGS